MREEELSDFGICPCMKGHIVYEGAEEDRSLPTLYLFHCFGCGYQWEASDPELDTDAFEWMYEEGILSRPLMTSQQSKEKTQ